MIIKLHRKNNKNETIFNTDHLQKDLKGRALKGGLITILSRIIDHSTQLIGTIILARLLTPEDFGLVAMITAISGFFMLFRDLGLTDATVQSEKITHLQISTLFWINLIFSAIIMIVFCLSAPFIAWFYNDPRLKVITIISSMTFLLAGLSTQHTALLRRNLSFQKIAMIEIISIALSTIGSILIALNGYGYWALVWRPIISSFFLTIGVWIVCEWKPGSPGYDKSILPMVKFGANTLGYYIVNYFSRNADKALIGWKFGPGPLGYYHKAFHLFVAPINQIVIPLQSVAVSALSKLRNDPEKYQRYFLKALTLLTFISVPVSAFTASVSKDIIMLLLGSKWIQTAEIFSILGWGAGIQIIYSTQGWIYVSLGKADRWFRWGVYSSLFTIASFIIGLPFGPKGIALSYTISLYILVIPAMVYAVKPINIKPILLLQSIWKYYLSAIVAAIACHQISVYMNSMNLIIKIINELVIYISIYLLTIVILYRSMQPLITNLGILKKIVIREK
jgi:PST family polysaccharide transporter